MTIFDSTNGKRVMSFESESYDRFDEEEFFDEDAPEDLDDSPMMDCPNCSHSIFEDSEQCPICLEYIVQASSQPPTLLTKLIIWFLILSLILPAILFAVLFLVQQV